MTNSADFVRLESLGLWRESPNRPKREIVVQLGDHSVTIIGKDNTILAHWSLLAVERVNPGRVPGIFTPDPQGEEFVEIADEVMLEALQDWLDDFPRSVPKPKRNYFRIFAAILLLAAVSGIVFFTPTAVIKVAASIATTSLQREVGESVYGHLQQNSKAICESYYGIQALKSLDRRLTGDGRASLRVVNSGIGTTILLPGGITVVDSSQIENADSPEVLAGHIVRARAGGRVLDPFEAFLADAGVIEAISFVVRGKFGENAARNYATSILSGAKEVRIPEDVLLHEFIALEIPTRFYARSIINTEGRLNLLLENDPFVGSEYPPVLRDIEWLGLKSICIG